MKKLLIGISFVALTGLAGLALADDTTDMNAATQQASESGDNLKTPDEANNLQTPDQANKLRTPDEAEAYRAAHPDENLNESNRGGPLQPAQALPPSTSKPYQPVDPRQPLYPNKANTLPPPPAPAPSP